DEAGTDGVGADAARSVAERDVLGEQDDAALSRVVRAAAGRTLEALDAGDHHDRAPFTVDSWLLDHPGQGRLGHQERAGEVDPDPPLPLGPVEQVNWAAAGDAGRMEDAVEAVGNGGQHRGDGRLIGYVGRDEPEFGPFEL